MEIKIEDNFSLLFDKNNNTAYKALQMLQKECEESDKVYCYMDKLADMIDNDNSYIRTRGLTLIAYNAKWDKDNKIDANTYIISEYRHWEETHCYLLNGNTRSLLIDTGLGISNIYEEVLKLTDKPVTAVATHIHWDHIGGREIEVLHTPGHSPGHLCFWEKAGGYLFTGDLVYKDILFAYYLSTDPEAYLDSLEKVAALPVNSGF